MKIDGDEVIFSTGKVRYANNGIIGLGPDLEVSEGYDGGFWSAHESEYKDEADILTPAERVELADYMIERWQAFRYIQGPAK